MPRRFSGPKRPAERQFDALHQGISAVSFEVRWTVGSAGGGAGAGATGVIGPVGADDDTGATVTTGAGGAGSGGIGVGTDGSGRRAGPRSPERWMTRWIVSPRSLGLPTNRISRSPCSWAADSNTKCP